MKKDKVIHARIDGKNHLKIVKKAAQNKQTVSVWVLQAVLKALVSKQS